MPTKKSAIPLREEETALAMIYQIPKWDERYENHKSRERQQCGFVCIPNTTGDLGFSRIMARKDGASIFGVFVLLLTVASRHGKPRQGWLTHDGTQEGIPMTAADFALMWRRSKVEVEAALEVLASPGVGWLAVHRDPVPVPVPAEHPPRVQVVPVEHPPRTRAVPAEYPPGARAVPVEYPPGARAVPAKYPPGTQKEGTKEENERTNPHTPEGGGEVLPLAEEEQPPEPTNKDWQPSEEQRRINSWFRRRDETPWSQKETRAFRKLPETTAEEWDLLEQYCLKATYRRKGILTLLNHWAGEIDRARAWGAEGENASPGQPASETVSGYHFTVPTGRDCDFEADFRALRMRKQRMELLLAGLVEPETEEEEALCR